jgi:hypothetical protein
MGCPSVLSRSVDNDLVQEQDFDLRIKNEFSISWEDYFNYRYLDRIKWMKAFAEHFDKDEFINIIKEHTDKWNLAQKPNMEASSPKDFFKPINSSEFFKNCLELEYVEFTDKVVEVHISKCIYAKTFISQDAADFGYASVCYGDFSTAEAYHPKLRLERTKTLMEGHECCNHRYIWEG